MELMIAPTVFYLYRIQCFVFTTNCLLLQISWFLLFGIDEKLKLDESLLVLLVVHDARVVGVTNDVDQLTNWKVVELHSYDGTW